MDIERNPDSETDSDFHYLRAAQRLKMVLETPGSFSVAIFISNYPEAAKDRKYGVRITVADGSEDTIDVYPNLDEDGFLTGFTHTSKFKQLPPEQVMQAFGQLQAQLQTEQEILEGLKRVEEGNDRADWKSVPMPPLGKIRKLDL